jgi:long-chain acyl-CoA synthetase
LYDQIDQICILGYLVDKKNKSEGIWAIIHPADKYMEEMAKQHTDTKDLTEAVRTHMQEIVDKVNKEMLPYKRISKLTVADEPLEMTSTKKIKRHIVAEVYKDR